MSSMSTLQRWWRPSRHHTPHFVSRLVLHFQEEVSWRQEVTLRLLGPALARRAYDLLAIKLRRDGDLHLHLHRLQYAERLPFLQDIAGLHRVGEELARHDSGELVR